MVWKAGRGSDYVGYGQEVSDLSGEAEAGSSRKFRSHRSQISGVYFINLDISNHRIHSHIIRLFLPPMYTLSSCFHRRGKVPLSRNTSASDGVVRPLCSEAESHKLAKYNRRGLRSTHGATANSYERRVRLASEASVRRDIRIHARVAALAQ